MCNGRKRKGQLGSSANCLIDLFDFLDARFCAFGVFIVESQDYLS